MTDPDDRDTDDGRGGDDGDRRGIHIEFGFSLSDLLDGFLGGSSRGRPGAGSRPGGRPSDRRPTATGTPHDREGTDESVDVHVETYRDGDELTIVADLPGVASDAVGAGIAEGTNDLVVLVDDRVVERVELPWPAVDVAGATFNNGVLELRVAAADDATA